MLFYMSLIPSFFFNYKDLKAWAIFGALLAGIGCRPSAENIPVPPQETVEALVDNLKAHQPQAFWYAMPESYQKDLKEVIEAFCDQMDPNIYDRIFKILGKAGEVLETKQSMFYNSPVALSTPFIDSMAGPPWDEVVGIINLIADSEMSSMERLRSMDPGKFLATTGSEFMDRTERLRNISSRPGSPDPWQKIDEMLESANIRFTKISENKGELSYIDQKNKQETKVQMVKVEGRWVPEDMNANWAKGISNAKEEMPRINGPEFQKIKPILVFGLSSLEGVLNQLLAAKSQQEFDQTLMTLTAVAQTFKALAPKNQPKPASKDKKEVSSDEKK